jgi:hypothetical protein
MLSEDAKFLVSDFFATKLLYYACDLNKSDKHEMSAKGVEKIGMHDEETKGKKDEEVRGKKGEETKGKHDEEMKGKNDV